MSDTERLIHYHARGSGPVVLLLHPSGVDRRMWESLAACLERSFGVVSIDRRGHGQSMGHERSYGIDASRPAGFGNLKEKLRNEERVETDDTENLLVSLGADSVSTLRVLDGGLLGLNLAARGRIRVPSVIMLDTVVQVGDTDVAEIVASGVRAGLDLHKRLFVIERGGLTRTRSSASA